MKRFALTTMLVGGISAGLLGTAGSAQAEHDYVYDDYGYASAPHVDTSVHTRTVIIRH